MPRCIRPASIRTVLIASLVLAGALLIARPALCDPTPGFVEDWPDSGQTVGWAAGHSVLDNPGHGGVGGADDGYLLMTTPTPDNLGAMSMGTQYQGNWQAAGIKSVRLWLNDVNTDEPLEIHFSIGTFNNFWQYNEAFEPPSNAWAEFTVDLTDSSKFTRIIGTLSFGGALQGVDRIHVRHDLAPYVQIPPDIIQGDFGLDRVELSDVSVPVLKSTWGRIKSLYR